MPDNAMTLAEATALLDKTLARPGRTPRGPEKQLQHEVVDYCCVVGLLVLVNQTGAVPIARPDGSRGYFRTGNVGAPDLLVVMPEGRVLFLELKAGKGKLRPTQEDWRDRLTSNGHPWAVCSTFGDAKEVIDYMAGALNPARGGWRHPQALRRSEPYDADVYCPDVDGVPI